MKSRCKERGIKWIGPIFNYHGKSIPVLKEGVNKKYPPAPMRPHHLLWLPPSLPTYIVKTFPSCLRLSWVRHPLCQKQTSLPLSYNLLIDRVFNIFAQSWLHQGNKNSVSVKIFYSERVFFGGILMLFMDEIHFLLYKSYSYDVSG